MACPIGAVSGKVDMAKKKVGAAAKDATADAQPTQQEVTIKLTGGMRRGAISIEAIPISLRKTGDGSFEGKKTITLEPPVITASSVVKGGLLASYDFAVTINNVTQHIKGVIRDGVKSDDENWDFATFNL